MVEYTTALSDLEMGGEQKTVVFLEKKSSTSWIWKVSGAILIMALCLGGCFFLALSWNGRPGMMKASDQGDATEKDHVEKTDLSNLRQVGIKAKAAIHLEGHYNEGVDKTLNWKNGQGQAFNQGGLHVDDDKIIIPSNGLYFVYSQASFKVSCSEEQGAKNPLMPLSHKILRYSDSIGSEAPLMSAIRSVCQSTPQEDGRGWYSAIYLGAVFKLNRGDKLWTETNHLAQLETEDGKTFFGVFKL